MSESIEALGLQELEAAEAAISAEESQLGLEWVGRDSGMNRADRRAKVRELKRLTRRPEACTTLHHPLTRALTPTGAATVQVRRAKAKAARAARKRSRG